MILCDTGPVVAVLNSGDQRHEQCAAFFRQQRGPLLVTPLVLTEICYFVEKFGGPKKESAFVRKVAAGAFRVVNLTQTDLSRMSELISQYADFPLGAADASVIAVAERLNLTSVATLDHRHFAVVRPIHTDHLVLLP